MKVSASSRAGLGFQSRPSRATDLQTGILVGTLRVTRRYGFCHRTGWPSASRLGLGEAASLIYSRYNGLNRPVYILAGIYSRRGGLRRPVHDIHFAYSWDLQ